VILATSAAWSNDRDVPERRRRHELAMVSIRACRIGYGWQALAIDLARATEPRWT
jgi:hypothetical protein